MTWQTFTRRTADPKLAWLERELDRAGIAHRRRGASFHAPILQVPAAQLDAAWAILDPVDDIDDADPRWTEGPCVTCGPFGECETCPDQPKEPTDEKV